MPETNPYKKLWALEVVPRAIHVVLDLVQEVLGVKHRALPELPRRFGHTEVYIDKLSGIRI